MSVYVDPLIAWPQAPKRGGEKHFGNGRQSCHMTCDGDLEELHRFAERIGLRRAWFQNHRFVPHYDLTPSKRALAVQLGAIETTGIDAMRRWKEREVTP